MTINSTNIQQKRTKQEGKMIIVSHLSNDDDDTVMFRTKFQYQVIAYLKNLIIIICFEINIHHKDSITYQGFNYLQLAQLIKKDL